MMKKYFAVVTVVATITALAVQQAWPGSYNIERLTITSDDNGRVNLLDLAMFSSQWLDCNLSIAADCID